MRTTETRIKGLIGYFLMISVLFFILEQMQKQTILFSVQLDTLQCHKKKKVESLPAVVTAYSNDPISINVPEWRDGLTASLTKAVVGTVAADRRFYEFGTEIYIPGYGFGEIKDTGGKITGRNRFDVFMETRGHAVEWGVVKTTVLIMIPIGDHVSF